MFSGGALIPVPFQLTPNTPTGVATTPPNHVGYGVLLDTGHTGCGDFTGVRQPFVTVPSAQTNFVYDSKHQEYDLKLAGIYKPGNYKLLINTGLSAEQCSPFVVTT